MASQQTTVQPGSGGQNAPLWGVFDSTGAPVAMADTFVEMDQRGEYRSTDAPVEAGAFQSYNKVQIPGTNHVLLGCGGGQAARAAFLSALDAACASLNLYSIVIPDATYLSRSLESYSFVRGRERGASLVVVALAFKQIRVTQAQYTTATKTPAGAQQFNGGKVQPTTPTTQQTSVLNDAVSGIQSYLDNLTGGGS